MSIAWYLVAMVWFIIGLTTDSTEAALAYCAGGFFFLFLGMLSKDKS